ncbi:hypothetical protein BXO88_06045 [Oribacterium sp. C9]|uniref:diacylglycerol kinase n=1 Tax=Oribacterium sp. C9 TaxID=1943579 RepID=UPI00098EF6F9|nr:diacylglycerol kinase [Oribacterium sp. C9]OON86821.1 hypothetical protein BXO88_06045 [Oribacterium sp. C9]
MVKHIESCGLEATVVSTKTFKNKTFLDSIICAARGMITAFKTEKNFAYYLFIAIFFLLFNLYIGVRSVFYIAYAIVVSGVISAELINTAVEHLCDFVSTDMHPALGTVKDIAAATVLFWGFGYFSVEIMILIETLGR